MHWPEEQEKWKDDRLAVRVTEQGEEVTSKWDKEYEK